MQCMGLSIIVNCSIDMAHRPIHYTVHCTIAMTHGPIYYIVYCSIFFFFFFLNQGFITRGLVAVRGQEVQTKKLFYIPFILFPHQVLGNL